MLIASVFFCFTVHRGQSQIRTICQVYQCGDILFKFLYFVDLFSGLPINWWLDCNCSAWTDRYTQLMNLPRWTWFQFQLQLIFISFHELYSPPLFYFFFGDAIQLYVSLQRINALTVSRLLFDYSNNSVSHIFYL